MNFRRPRREEPDINLIPFIDVLLVVLIFLMLSTTYTRFTELQVSLPVAQAEPMRERPDEVLVSVAADGRYAINGEPLPGRSVEGLAGAMSRAASALGAAGPGPVVIVSADASAAHQSVVNVLDAARRAGLPRVTFATQAAPGADTGVPTAPPAGR
ncbi:biopolymer transporter ExbD [Aquincola sp. J276]|uniref:ExbD/TolR family protein n=1 Tax=Aquincola sp. J276 TaxID=2898432 RepID=UPI0021517F7A|nr:biopolymer transporter ExbD [Aquincola sp. J276]MCR5864378.1 biopolymer transporter ExbD [Aquincola sp. J276]